MADKPTKTQIAVELILRCIELFHDDERAYAVVPPSNVICPIPSKDFGKLLRDVFYQSTGDVLGSIYYPIVETIEAIACKSSPQFKTYSRFAEVDGCLFIDLANEDNQAIKITADGWYVINQSPVKFIRAQCMRSLPIPTEGGNIHILRELLNVEDDTQFALIIAWLVGAARGRGPYPILLLSGEHGSAKSSTAKILKSLVDPSEAPLRSQPREERDLMISAEHNHILSYDNLSYIPGWLSDCLCRLSTGGGFGKRQLFKDSDEVIFKAQRPVIINSITDIATRADLLDRCIIVTLPAINQRSRKKESELTNRFEQVHPDILGGLCSVISEGLRNQEKIHLKSLPRMADFAHWITAAESRLGWEPGYFLSIYDTNRKSINEIVLESSPVASVLQLFINDGSQWSGTSTELLEELNKLSSDQTKRDQEWPKNARSLSAILRRIAPNLRAIGIDLQFIKEKVGEKRKLIQIEKAATGKDRNFASLATPASPNDEKTGDANGVAKFIGVATCDTRDTIDFFATPNLSSSSGASTVSSAKNPHLSTNDQCKHKIARSACSVCHDKPSKCQRHDVALVPSEFGLMCSLCFDEIESELIL